MKMNLAQIFDSARKFGDLWIDHFRYQRAKDPSKEFWAYIDAKGDKHGITLAEFQEVGWALGWVDRPGVQPIFGAAA